MPGLSLFSSGKIKKAGCGRDWHTKCIYSNSSDKLSCLLGTSLPAAAGAYCEIRANQGEKIMTLSALKFIYIVCDMIAIGTGAAVLFGLIAGKLLGDYTVFFLRFALATSVAGLLFPWDNVSSWKISMLSIYLSGLAVIAWRKFHLARVWRPMFVLSTTIVLYLSCLVAIAQFFEWITAFTALAPSPTRQASLVARLLVTVLFVMLGTRAIKGFGHGPSQSNLAFKSPPEW
jgi:hypothetical protein